jgi:hypothetical protein
MRITAQGSGGFAGQAEQFEVDTARVAAGRSIEAMLRDMDFFSRSPAPAVGADLVTWTITVDDGVHRHSVRFADDGSAASAPWQALLAQLRAAA